MSELKKYKLSEIAYIKMGQSPDGESCNEDGVGIPLLNGPSEFTDFYPIPKQFTINAKRFSEEGEILFCVRGSTTGRMNWSNGTYAIGRGLASITHKEGKQLNHFLKYLIHSNLDSILKAANGSTFPNLTSDIFASFELTVPDLPTQQKIASVLSSLDAKIELNNRINTELEAMAKTLYDYWFVQFDFPNAEGKPYKSSGGKMVWSEELKREIPEGWEVNKLDNVIDLILDHRGKTPLKLGGDWVSQDEGVVAISAKHVKNGKLEGLETANRVGFDMFEKWMPEKLIDGDILMTSEAPLGEFFFILNYTNYCMSQRLFAIRADKQNVLPLYLFYELSKGNGYSQIIGSKSGSTVFGIRQNELRKINILKPDLRLQKEFEKISLPMIAQIRINEQENQQLAHLRDWLLPMLMNGQVAVE
jgi:type I restriction enzyme S subunit